MILRKRQNASFAEHPDELIHLSKSSRRSEASMVTE